MTDFIEDFKIANQALREQELNTAVVFYQYALQRCPTNWMVHENLGDALYGLGDDSESLAAYQQAIVLYPKAAHSHAQCGHIFTRQARYSLAIPSFRQAINLIPTCIPYSEGLTKAQIAKGAPMEASKTYKRLGAVSRHAGLLDEAIGAYQKALALQPTSAELHQALGECLHRRSDFADAAQHYQAAEQHAEQPRHLWFYKNWGEALLLSESSQA